MKANETRAGARFRRCLPFVVCLALAACEGGGYTLSGGGGDRGDFRGTYTGTVNVTRPGGPNTSLPGVVTIGGNGQVIFNLVYTFPASACSAIPGVFVGAPDNLVGLSTFSGNYVQSCTDAALGSCQVTISLSGIAWLKGQVDLIQQGSMVCSKESFEFYTYGTLRKS